MARSSAEAPAGFLPTAAIEHGKHAQQRITELEAAVQELVRGETQARVVDWLTIQFSTEVLAG
jgi:hypothetical protein